MHKLLAWLNPRDKSAGLTRWWHLHVLLGSLGAFVAGVVLTLAGAFAVHQIIGHAQGGAKPSQLSAPVEIRGGVVPASHLLTPFVTRLHNQDDSSSCVGQTVSTMTEILAAEGGHRLAFSPGFIWDVFNGGNKDNGMTYTEAFTRLVQFGDAPLKVFRADGQSWNFRMQPGPAAYAAARRWRAARFYSIDPSDKASIETAIAHGYPLAYATGWQETWKSHWNTTDPLPADSGTYWFRHSTTFVGYTPAGVILLNSWGPTWGHNGQAVLPWDVLASTPDAELVVALPAYSTVHVIHHFDSRVWNEYRAEHHLRLIPYKSKHGLTLAAKVFDRQPPARIGGIVSPERWFPRGPHGHRGFEVDQFQGRTLVYWPRRPQWGIKLVPHRWLR